MRNGLVLAAAVLVASCGGGGDDGPPPRLDVYVADAVEKLYNPRTTIPVRGTVNGATITALLTFTDAPGLNSTWSLTNTPTATRVYGLDFVISGPGGTQSGRTSLVQHFRIPDAQLLGYVEPDGARVQITAANDKPPLLMPVPTDGSALSGLYRFESTFPVGQSFPSERYRLVWDVTRASDPALAWVCLKTLNEFASGALVGESCGLTSGAGPFRQWRFVLQLPGFGPIAFTSI